MNIIKRILGKNKKKEGCSCQNCANIFSLDLNVPDDVWSKIKPKDKPDKGGLLCPSCILKRIEEEEICYSVNLTTDDKEKEGEENSILEKERKEQGYQGTDLSKIEGRLPDIEPIEGKVKNKGENLDKIKEMIKNAYMEGVLEAVGDHDIPFNQDALIMSEDQAEVYSKKKIKEYKNDG